MVNLETEEIRKMRNMGENYRGNKKIIKNTGDRGNWGT